MYMLLPYLPFLSLSNHYYFEPIFLFLKKYLKRYVLCNIYQYCINNIDLIYLTYHTTVDWRSHYAADE